MNSDLLSGRTLQYKLARMKKIEEGIAAPVPNDVEWLTSLQVASLLQISLRSVFRMTKNGHLTSHKISRRVVRWHRSTVDKYLQGS